MSVGVLRAARSVGCGLRQAFDLVLPQVCVCCGRGVESARAPVCRLCWHRLPRMNPPWCGRCGATTTSSRISSANSARCFGCAECLEWPVELPRACAPYSMGGDAIRVVHGLKYGGWRRLAEPMGWSMTPAAARLVGRRTPVVVPVPLSRARRRERGFNQARLLAAALSRATGWPVAEVIERLPGGRPQARLGRRERARNMDRRFGARPDLTRIAKTFGPADAFLLVDDVLTTGATAAACARVLGESGLPCLGVVTFARAVGRLTADT